MKKRLLSTLLALCMALTLLPVQTMAAEMDSDGTEPLPPVVEDEESEAPEEEAELSEESQQGTESPDELYTGQEVPAEPSALEEVGLTEETFVEVEEGTVSAEESEDLAGQATPEEVGLVAPQALSGTLTYPVDGGNIYFDPETGTVTSCDSSVTKAEIPSSIDGVAVRNIEARAFSNRSGLTSITIPNGVTNIGEFAFEDCSGLTDITIPYSAKNIGKYVFSGCRGLTSVMLPNSMTSIAEGMFSDCSGLTSVTIPNNVTSIGNHAFGFCSRLTSITIPNSVTSMGHSVFFECSGLTNVVISTSITSIESNAFSGCRGLTSITIPNSVTSIENHAFANCSGLTSVIVPDSVMSIGGSAFVACSGLTGITLPSSLTSIGLRAFGSCSGLTSVVIPDSVTSIGNSAFSDCFGLTNVTLSSSLTSIGDSVFSNCVALTSVDIPASITIIGRRTFWSCDKLTDIMLPSGLTSIGDEAFHSCNGLTNVYYAGTESQWNAILIGEDNEPLTSATIHYNTNPPEVPPQVPPEEDETVEINTDAYYATPEKRLFRIRPISTDFRNPAGFLVTVGQESFSSGNTTCTSTDDVTVMIPKDYTGNIEISLKGYHTNYLPASWVGGTNTVAMTPDSVTTPYFRTMLVKTGRASYPVYTNLATDYKRCELSVYKPGLTGKPNPLEYYTSVDWNGHGEGTVWMEQGDKKIDLKNNGVTETAIESVFDSGKTIYVCARAADGTLLRNVLRVTVNEPQKDGFKAIPHNSGKRNRQEAINHTCCSPA